MKRTASGAMRRSPAYTVASASGSAMAITALSAVCIVRGAARLGALLIKLLVMDGVRPAALNAVGRCVESGAALLK